MSLIKTLFYKFDDRNNQMRISKTKIITWVVFVSFFVFSLYTYLNTPSIAENNIILLLIVSILVGLIFAVPTFVIGWLISKILNRVQSKEYSENNKITNKNTSNTPVANDIDKNNCPHNYANEFKKAVENDNVDLASKILSKWDENDANYNYARIIFDGMPPTELSLKKLEEMLHSADNMNACDKTLKEWFKSTAIEVIKLNK